MRISDWSSDVCSSDLFPLLHAHAGMDVAIARGIEHRAQAARRDGRERDRLKLSGRGAIGTGAANALPTLVPIFEVPGARRRHADAGARGLVGDAPEERKSGV